MSSNWTSVSNSLQSEGIQYWVNKWELGDTPWQKDYIDPALKANVSCLRTADGTCSVFVPLCGKTLDMLYLSKEGFDVVGCDISALAATQFYSENSLAFEKMSNEKITMYYNAQTRIKFAIGDIFDCSVDSMETGPFDGIWDCNALVAINPEDRKKYTKLLCSLLKPNGRILLSTFDYEQSARNEFPHSIPECLVKNLFEPCHTTVSVLETRRPSEDELLVQFMSVCGVSSASRPIFSIEKTRQ